MTVRSASQKHGWRWWLLNSDSKQRSIAASHLPTALYVRPIGGGTGIDQPANVGAPDAGGETSTRE